MNMHMYLKFYLGWLAYSSENTCILIIEGVCTIDLDIRYILTAKNIQEQIRKCTPTMASYFSGFFPVYST